ncbi:hypothetical protein ACLKA6_001108 [Drosophila palustris]
MKGPHRSNITAQGFGYPVPAADGGVQADPQPSIYSDRNASVVANLATVADKATSNLLRESKEGEPPTGRMTPNPFLGSKKTARSPTSAPAATSRLVLSSSTTPVCRPSTGIADKPESRQPGLITSFDRLGEKIRALSKMLEGRRTIHQPMRDLVDSNLGLYVAAEEEQSEPPASQKHHKATSTVTPNRQVKTQPKLRSLAQHVKTIRKTAKGELLFELSKSADPHTATLQDAVKDLLGSKAEVRSLTATTAIEVRDLDEVKTQEELLEALITHFGEIKASSSSIISLRKSYGGTQTASLKLPADEAEKLLQAGKAIITEIHSRAPVVEAPRRAFFRLDTLDKPAFEQMLEGAETSGNAIGRAEKLMSHILRACNASMRKTIGGSRQKAVYWWNSGIAEARLSSLRARRAYQRARRRDDARHEELQDDYRSSEAYRRGGGHNQPGYKASTNLVDRPSKENWDAVDNMAREVMKELRREERTRAEEATR